MTGLLWLPSRPQSSFKIPILTGDDAANLYLISLGSPVADILLLYHMQIIQLDSIDLVVKDEILLEAPIEAFKFDPVTLKLTLKLAASSGDESDELEIVTVTGKNYTWSLDCPLRSLVLTFSDSGALSCTLPDENDSQLPQAHQPVLEIIKSDHVASLSPSKLKLLLKSDRSIVSSVRIPESEAASQFNCQSLIWVDEDIFVFRALDDHFQVFKFPLIQSASPTNVTTTTTLIITFTFPFTFGLGM